MNHYSLLHHLFQAGEHTKVISTANELSITPEQDPLSVRVLAASHFMIGDYSSADYLLSNILSSFATDPSYLSLYAATKRRLGDFTKAEDLFLKALDLDPKAIDVCNNYANLLIDMGRLSDSKTILVKLVDENPNYQDAKVNLERLIGLEKVHNSKSASSEGSSSDGPSPSSFDDPLLLAFAQNEVKYSSERYGLLSQVKMKDNHDFKTVNSKSISDEQLALAFKAIDNGDTDLALKLCSEILNSTGISGSVYECVADTFLKKDNFILSELLLLHSLVIGGSSLKHYVNLISFACMRNDYLLAELYLDKASLLDPNSDKLARLRDQVTQQKSLQDKPFSFASI